MRVSRYLAVPVAAVLLVACGGEPSATVGDDETPVATTTPDEGGGGGGGGEGVGAGEIAGLRDQLVPPDSTRTSNTEVPGGLAASYTSTSSIDELRSYYEGRFDELGLTVVSTSDASGGVVWVFSDDDLADFAGSVSLLPFGDVTQVSIGLGAAAD